MQAVTIFLALLVVAWFFWSVYRFLHADGDFTILRKGPIPPNAFNDKVVWITGASKGIGEALAKDFARHGAKLILSARMPSDLERVRATLSGLNAPDAVVILPFDLAAGEKALRAVVEEAEAAFDGQGVDIMVHNASCERHQLQYSDISEDLTKTSFAINVFGPIALTRLLAPKMLKRGRGHFVVISSVVAKMTDAGRAVYVATKAALHGYFDAARSEMGNTGIKFSVICPGPVWTNPTSNLPSHLLGKVMELPRATELILKSTHYELDETWVSTQPALFMMYLQQHCPNTIFRLMQKIGPIRLKRKTWYDWNLVLRGK